MPVAEEELSNIKRAIVAGFARLLIIHPTEMTSTARALPAYYWTNIPSY